ncbi:MAG: hypothetical protein GY714_11725 [Desulfobacterales bacterium]|nr:hypothetical protein [Desulfobacterales bacterium]MCP4158914.1 hypothetical protein [Deltaproteobacteria bacterium]
MDLNEIIRTITQEVLKNINGEKEKDCVFVLENRGCDLVFPVLEYLGDEVEILFLDDDLGSKKPSRYVLPTLSCGRMADIALGRTSEPLVEKVVKLLLSGVKVETLEFEYKSYLKTAPESLYKLYESYEESLAAFGLTMIEEKTESLKVKKGLITEKDIVKAVQDGVLALEVSKKAIITPLAVEIAREKNVKLLKS